MHIRKISFHFEEKQDVTNKGFGIDAIKVTFCKSQWQSATSKLKMFMQYFSKFSEAKLKF